MRRLWEVILILILALPWPTAVQAVRLKEIADIQGVRENPLIGYGLIVGLQGTGDKNNTQFTVQSLANMLQRLGIQVPADQVKVKNVAAVMVTAKLLPFVRPGQRLDVQVASIGDAQSLRGGTLLMTPLRGTDGQAYAVAQGPVSVGGFAFGGASGGTVQQNHPTVGTIPNGAIVERQVAVPLEGKSVFRFVLHRADFTTAQHAAQAIGARWGEDAVHSLDARTLEVRVPEAYRSRVGEFLALTETVEVQPDASGRIILDERTGTVVMGEMVRVDPVAIAQGGLTVIIKERPEVSQPLPFSSSPSGAAGPTTAKGSGAEFAPGGQTVVVLEPRPRWRRVRRTSCCSTAV
jgi:flagellar P-ring protein precursor FlgI